MKKFISIILVFSILIISAGCGKNDAQLIDDNYRNYYEVFVYSFYDSDGDGIGDLSGVSQKLSYIKNIGFDGIWLMPIMPSTTYHKYDVIDYTDIDPEYGTIDDMKMLVEKSHKEGINIIIDFVMNHSSSKHPWFENACEFLKTVDASDKRTVEELAEENQYVGYYHFSKEKLNGTYYSVPGTDFYYEGSFWSEMPDLNYSSSKLKEEFERIADFWVGEIGVDGFRMDATMHFEEGDTNFNTDTMNWIYEYCKSINPDFYMVSEVWASESTIATYYQSKTDSLFNFDAADAEGKIIKCARGNTGVEKFVRAMKSYEDDFGAFYEDYIDAVFITNHDMGRVCNALNSDENAMKFAAGLLMSMNGSSFVYYGEEIGMKSKGKKDENKRLPMLWGEEKGNTLGPIDADSDIEQKFPDVKEQLLNKSSILNYYKDALEIRNSIPAIARGKIDIIEEVTEKNHAAILKSYGNERVVILYNNSVDEEYTFDFSDTEYKNFKIAASLTLDDSKIKMKKGSVVVPGRGIVYLVD